MTSKAGAEGASPGTELGAWAHVMQAERAVRCPSDAAAVATAAYKQGIILERFGTALRLRRSKGSREASNLMNFARGD